MYNRTEIPKNVKKAIREVYNGVCQYCQSEEGHPIDHIVPVAKGGGNNIENLTLACQPCNGRKMDSEIPETYLALIMAIAARKAPAIERILSREDQKQKRIVPEKVKTAPKPKIQKPPEKELKIVDAYYALPEKVKITADELLFLKEICKQACPFEVLEKGQALFEKVFDHRRDLSLYHYIEVEALEKRAIGYVRLTPGYWITYEDKNDQNKFVVRQLTLESISREWLENVDVDNPHALRFRTERDIMMLNSESFAPRKMFRMQPPSEKPLLFL